MSNEVFVAIRTILREVDVSKTVAFMGASALGLALLVSQVEPGQALTMQECSAKYKAAQATGNKLKWNDFRKAECAADAAATPAGAPAAAAPAKPAAAPKPATAAKPAEAPAPAASGNAMFPNAVAPKYSTESAGKARMHTCLDQYNANKATNANGGLKWIAKGGGYYSECNKRLKS
jgi:hypothetical protein